MGMFGGGSSATTNSTTTVAPQQYITDMLQQITGYADGIDPGHYIEHQHAGFNPTQQRALQMMADSTGLNELGGLLAPLASTGAGIYKGLGSDLEGLASGKGAITPETLLAQANLLENSPTAAQASQAVGNTVAASAGALGASPAATASASGNLADANATAELGKQAGYQKMAQGLLEGDQKALTQGLRQAGGLGSTMIGEGKTGAKDLNEAIQQEMKAGELSQKEQQAEYNNDWQNAMGRELFPWEHADNMLNTLNKVSRMAGYTVNRTSKRSNDGGSFFSPVNIGKRMKATAQIAGMAALML